MSWREAYDIRSNGNVSDGWLDELDRRLAVDEAVSIVATPMMWYDVFGTVTSGPVGVVVTSARVLFFKKRLTRYVLAEHPILGFVDYSLGLFMGGGPMWELKSQIAEGQLRMVFTTYDEAALVAEHINGAVAMARA